MNSKLCKDRGFNWILLALAIYGVLAISFSWNRLSKPGVATMESLQANQPASFGR